MPNESIITTAPTLRPLMTVAQACEYTSLSEPTIRRLLAEKRIGYWKLGRSIRFDVSDLDAYMVRVEPVASVVA